MDNKEHQVDVNKVIESLIRQVADYAQKVALLEAYIAQIESRESNKQNVS